MVNILKINRDNNTIVMDRAFAKASEVVGSEEYNMLQTARRDYPTYTVVRRRIKRNPNKECYKGLTYEYMENYILIHCKEKMEEYQELRLIAKCHSIRYPTIKKWFLESFPEIVEFGLFSEKPAEDSEVTAFDVREGGATALNTEEKKIA